MTAARTYPTPADIRATADELLARHGASCERKLSITHQQGNQATKPTLTRPEPITPDRAVARVAQLEGYGLSPGSARVLAEQEQEAGTLERPGVRWLPVWGSVQGEPEVPVVARRRVTLGGYPEAVRTGRLPAMRWADRVPLAGPASAREGGRG